MVKVVKKAAQKAAPKVVIPRKSLHVKKVKRSNGSMQSFSSTELTPQVIQSETDTKLKPTFVQVAVKHLISLIKEEDSKNTLFDDDKTVYLQINTVKIPKCPTMTLNIDMQHSVLPSDYEVVLITADLKNEKKTDYDKNIEHYKSILDQNEITCVKEIIPLHQVKACYTEYEMQNKLIGLYDMFVVDSSVDGYVRKIFGHLINKRKKLYGPVKIAKTNLKGAFEKLLRHSELHIHSKGDTYTMQVGHTGMDEEHLVENIMAAADALDDKLPGGFINVRGLFLKTSHSKAIQFYMSCINSSKIKVPAVKQVKAETNKAVKGELSTQMDSQVTVLPGGDVLLKTPKLESDEDDQSEPNVELKDEELADNQSETRPKSTRVRKNTVPEPIVVEVKKPSSKKKQSNKENEEVPISVAVAESSEKLEPVAKKRLAKKKAPEEEASPLATTTKANAKKGRSKKGSEETTVETIIKAPSKPKGKGKKAAEVVEEVKEETAKVEKPKSSKSKASKKIIEEDVEAPVKKKKSPKRKIAPEVNEPIASQAVEKKRGRTATKKSAA